ncbi:Dihydrolipoyl dehydrogenase [Candidatus Providencia siddallii]|uniref:Dihydrolipoyl dehydrogenase n=2 Tax=Candidatus Providencia siddallii TaxID=1715285 RepID=A0ABP1CFH4_9GAMM
MNKELKTQVVVLGAGPSGYSAAFRCADLGLQTFLIESSSTLGGVCLNTGCIPSKTLLHVTKIIKEVKELIKSGIILNEPKYDINKIRILKEKIINKLTNNLSYMAKNRNVKIIKGFGKFNNSKQLIINEENNNTIVNFDNAIIAAGSSPIRLPFMPKDHRIWDSTDALELKEIPKRMLIIGGGIIGLEMGSVYYELGSKIDIVEMSDQIIPNADKDIIKVFTKQINKQVKLLLETKITSVEAKKDGIYVSIENKNSILQKERYDIVLVAIGREPNGKKINADKAGIKVNENGFIYVDKQMRTNIENIFAIGDITGQPMLAHKGIHESHIAAEVICNLKHYFDPKVIPSIAYTYPEIAWIGLTEKEAKKQNIEYDVSIFPWNASGRAITSGYTEGLTKLIFDKNSNQIIGGAVVGVNGSELLGEIGLAIEMGCDAEDISLTIHGHPTLYETICMAAKIHEGTITDLQNIKLKK